MQNKTYITGVSSSFLSTRHGLPLFPASCRYGTIPNSFELTGILLLASAHFRAEVRQKKSSVTKKHFHYLTRNPSNPTFSQLLAELKEEQGVLYSPFLQRPILQFQSPNFITFVANHSRCDLRCCLGQEEPGNTSTAYSSTPCPTKIKSFLAKFSTKFSS